MTQGKRVPHLVAYDIRDPSRGQRILKLLKEEGIPMQYSLFFCQLDARRRRRLAQHIEHLIDPRCDDVRFYPLPSNPWYYRWGRDAVRLEHLLLGLDDGGLFRPEIPDGEVE